MERDFKDDIPFIYRNDFNSHAHVERDSGVFAIFVKFFTNFNSHAHVERDDQNWNGHNFVANFNSHAHVERDLTVRVLSMSFDKFQLTRSRGA